MIQIPRPFDEYAFIHQRPSDEAGLMVTMGWSIMKNETEMNYDIAYAMNLGGYMAGHPEGASNIGKLILHEHLSTSLHQALVGGHESFEVAEAWFLKAMESKFHSPQAEIEMTSVIVLKSINAGSKALIEKYLKQGEENIKDPASLWADEKDYYLSEIKSRRSILEYSFKKKSFLIEK